MNPVHADIGFWRYAASARSEVRAALRRESFRAVATGLLWDGRPDVPAGGRLPSLSRRCRTERAGASRPRACLRGPRRIGESIPCGRTSTALLASVCDRTKAARIGTGGCRVNQATVVDPPEPENPSAWPPEACSRVRRLRPFSTRPEPARRAARPRTGSISPPTEPRTSRDRAVFDRRRKEAGTALRWSGRSQRTPNGVIQAFHLCGTNCGRSLINYCFYFIIGGEGGIRTLGTLLTYTHFPGVLLKPLGHLSGGCEG